MSPLLAALSMYALAAVVAFAVAGVIQALVWATRPRAAAATPAHTAVAPAVAESGPTAEQVAVIAAALAAVLGPHRIVRIEPARGGRGWVEEARLDHHGSHSFDQRRQRAGSRQ